MDGNALLTIAGVVAATATTSATLAIWISREFSKTRASFYEVLAVHEKEDEDRHIDNLGRFADIRILLASMGHGVPPTKIPTI